MPGTLEILGELLVEAGPHALRVEARGATIEVELPNIKAGWELWRQFANGRQRRRTLGGLDQALRSAGLTVRVMAAGILVGILGAEARPGLVSQILGVAPVELKLGGVLAASRFKRADPAPPRSAKI
jgi:hypothetical protein